MIANLALDLFTLVLAAALFNALEAIGILALWVFHRRSSGLLFWAISLVMKAVALPILALATDGQLPIVALLVANALMVLAAVFAYAGNCSFLKIRVSVWWITAALAVYFVVYCYLLFVSPDLAARVIWISGFLVVFYGLAGWVLVFRSPKAIWPAARITGGIFLLGAFAHTVRIIEVVRLGPPGSLLDPGMVAYTAIIGSIIALALWTFGCYLMVSEWRAAAIAVEQERKLEAERRQVEMDRIAGELRDHAERQELLGDMHDGLGSMMANLSFLTAVARQEDSQDGLRASLEQLEFLTSEMSLELKSVMNVVANAEMHWGDLIGALRQFTERTTRERRAWLHWQVSAHPLPDAAGSSAAAFLFQRLIKEVVAGVVTRCEGGQIGIRWRFGRNQLVIVMRSSECEAVSEAAESAVTTSGADPESLGARVVRRERTANRNFSVTYLIVPLPLVIHLKSA